MFFFFFNFIYNSPSEDHDKFLKYFIVISNTNNCNAAQLEPEQSILSDGPVSMDTLAIKLKTALFKEDCNVREMTRLRSKT